MFIAYFDLQSFEVVAFGNGICQVFEGFQRPRLYLSAVDVSRAPKSRGMSGNVPARLCILE